MPVVRIDLRRFSKMVGVDRKRILERLPYIGLDIESVEGDSVRVEYSPNRPDFGSDFGVARAMRGLLGKEVGIPRFRPSRSGATVVVDRRLSRVRPFISCAEVTGLHLDDEDIRQLISLQEDLHNGLGRTRRVVAIGLHDLSKVRPPFRYQGVGADFRFIPLGGRTKRTIASILSSTPEGRAYGSALPKEGPFPVIVDSEGTVLSFPPVINGNATAVTTKTKGIFIDVTSTVQKAGDDVLSIIATTLTEAGGRLWTVNIRQGGKSRTTPDLTPVSLPLKPELVRNVLGLSLTDRQIADSLAKSRLAVSGKRVLAARYRVDLLHPVDVAEEVALGYGVDRIGPVYPASPRPGNFDSFEQFLDSASTLMAGSGMVEMMTFELVDEQSLYTNFGRTAQGRLAVHDPRSLEHSVLRDSLIPSLAAALSGNVKADYPQRVFEIGRVYARTKEGTSESFHLGCLIAHSQSSFSEAKMHLEAMSRTLTGKEASSKQARHWEFAEGRCASVEFSGRTVGHVGELAPEVIAAFGLKVPVSGFEVDLSLIHELLK